MNSSPTNIPRDQNSPDDNQQSTPTSTKSLKQILIDADWNISQAQKQYSINTIIAWLYRFFLRDLDWQQANYKVLIIEANLFSGFITFLIAFITQYAKSGEFTIIDQVIIIGIGVFSVLISGIFVDALIMKKNVYAILSGINLISMIVMIYCSIHLIRIVFASILSFTTFFEVVMFFNHIVSWTNLLNRGRSVSIIICLTGAFTGPFILAINYIPTFNWTWIPIIVLLVILNVFGKQNLPIQIGQIKTENAMAIRNLIRIIIESSIVSYCLFFFFASAVLGFYITLIMQEKPTTVEIIITVIVVIFAFFFIGACLDNYGRKPVIIFTFLVVCGISLFSDYPTPILISEGFETFRFVFFILSAVIVLILTIVLAGDNATHFRRGRIIGLFVFAAIIGAILGITIINTTIASGNLTNFQDLVKVTDWITLLLIFAILFISRVEEPFDKYTPKWRNYLNKLYLMHNIGVGIYGNDFKKNTSDHEKLNEDLVSGGLLGIDSMIKEISETQGKIQILEHGDQKMIFHHGKYSVAVLFVEKDLVIFREKLAGFHESFECSHEEALQKFSGNITSLSRLDDLKNYFFD